MASVLSATRTVFLAFSEGDYQAAESFRQATRAAAPNLRFVEYAVHRGMGGRTRELPERVKARLRDVSVTVCLIGTNTAHDRWVAWELALSRRLGKGLVGVRLHRLWQDRPPEELVQAGRRCSTGTSRPWWPPSRSRHGFTTTDADHGHA